MVCFHFNKSALEYTIILFQLFFKTALCIGCFSTSSNSLTVLFLTVTKVWSVYRPHSAIESLTAKILVVLSWVLAIAPVIFVYLYTKKFTENMMWWNFGRNPDYINSLGVVAIVFMLVPMALIIILNIILSVVTIKYSVLRSRMYRALIFTCSLSSLFVFSWLLLIIFYLLQAGGDTPPLGFKVVAYHFVYLNSFGNPFLYTITNNN